MGQKRFGSFATFVFAKRKDLKKFEIDESLKFSDKEILDIYVDDFEKSIKLLEDIGACVAIFGSARFEEDNFYYKKGVEIAKKFANRGFHVVTGGSSGIMEAANRGAYEVKDIHSIGFNLHLPFEQATNEFTTKDVTLNSFGIRKQMLLKNTTSCVILPGGYGTLDELFDVITLVVSGKILPISIHLVGQEFWQPLLDFVENTLVKNKVITKKEAELLQVSDDLDEVLQKAVANVEVYLKAMENANLQNTPRYELIKKQFGK